jgi:5-methylcytosine-specific restriction endonuclease McrA
MAFRSRFLRRRNGVTRIQRDSYSNDKVDWWDMVAQVRRRDRDTCQKCGETDKEVKARSDSMDTHHIIPLSRGGRTILSNLELRCGRCHSKARGHGHMRKK